MSLAETMANSFLKSLDINKLLAAPQVSEALASLRKIVSDFEAIKQKQDEIISHLDTIETAMRKSPNSGLVFPNHPCIPVVPAQFNGAMSNE